MQEIFVAFLVLSKALHLKEGNSLVAYADNVCSSVYIGSHSSSFVIAPKSILQQITSVRQSSLANQTLSA